MNLEETPLPGIGVRREVTLSTGRRVGVVMRRDGELELIVSQREDPDACQASVRLTNEEAAALGGMLGSPQLVAHLSSQHSGLPGVNTQQFVLSDESPYVEGSLGDTRLRTRTGASIVAVSRAGQVVPSPPPEFRLSAGDVLVVVGTADGLDRAAELLANG
ncbi:cation:proton antiporter regulatory subunit [Arthrobacter sp. KK5.5]|uniref:cation:proton antiporter regulatory subunit n=1 Tax=Arthrobacter sp. KK5.5 TaxID=3373084 RepID=UPI003EE4BABE